MLKIHSATIFMYHEIYPKLVRNDCVIKNNGSLSDSKSIPSSANDTVNFCPRIQSERGTQNVEESLNESTNKQRDHQNRTRGPFCLH